MAEANLSRIYPFVVSNNNARFDNIFFKPAQGWQ